MRVVLIAALALVGCSGGSGEPSGPSDSSKILVGQNAVKELLRDGDNADFRSLRLGSVREAEVVCGEVNSTNGFGGKSGYQRFISNGGSVTVLEEQMEPSEFAKAWAATGC